MKQLRLLPNVLFAFLIVISLAFQAPLPVEAADSAAPLAGRPNMPPPRPADPQPAEQSGWVTVASMDFEGAFPGTWIVQDNKSPSSPKHLWGPATARPYNGSKSGWPISGGSSGSPPTTPPTSYPANVNTGIGYGPFSLVGATDARMTFWLYLDTESNGDFVKWQASDDGGQGWGGDGMSGNSNGWTKITYDLKNFDGQGSSLLGISNAWVAITFESNGSNNNYGGAYIDDIVIEKMTAAPTCYTLTTANTPPEAGTITTSPATNCGSGASAGYTAGTVVTVKANAKVGYKFKNWTGDYSGSATNSQTQVTMNGNRSVTANYETECYTLSTSVTPNGAGNVTVNPSPNCSSTTYSGGTVVTITANATSGYTFANWSGAVTGSKNPETVTMNGNQSVTAHFSANPTCYTLSTSTSPTGGGTTEADTAPNCEGGKYTSGTVVKLTAKPNSGYSFKEWSGAVSGTANPVSVTMDGNKSVTATFTAIPTCYTLTTSASPSGSGQVKVGTPTNCGSGASAGYTAGTQVQLTAEPAEGYKLDKWSGGGLIGSANPVTVTMDGNKSITATFARLCYTLTTSVASGSGSIAASPAPTCNNNTQYYHGTQVELTATAASGYTFSAWGGALAGSKNPETLTMTADRTVTASFSVVQQCYTLTASASPANGGQVTANPGPNCENNTKYTAGTEVTLTASPASGYSFVGWGGAASGSETSVKVTMSANHTVTATFAPICYTLTTTIIPQGGGTVSANPSPNCTGGSGYTPGTKVTLTASPAPTYTFTRWGGAAGSGTGLTAEVTMNGDKTATATFTQVCYTLTTTIDPSGGGTITAEPLPNCDSGKKYVTGTEVTLTAIAKPGFTFANWSGAVNSTNATITVKMDGDRSAKATFNAVPNCYTLGITISPTGGGTVSPQPAPNCEGTKYTAGTKVKLTASPAAGYTFKNWSGAASGTALTAEVTMDANKSVTAAFEEIPECYTLTTGISPTGGGSVSLSPNPNCDGGKKYTYGTKVTLTASPSTGYRLLNWSGDVTGATSPVQVTMDGDKTVTANFTLKCYSLSTTVAPNGGGTVAASPAPNCEGAMYTHGTQVTLTATPSTGYTFGSWSGAASGNNPIVQVTMTADRTATAAFNIKCYALTTAASPEEYGSVTVVTPPNCEGGKYTHGTPIEITANAKEGYVFNSWSGGLGTDNPVTVTITGDITVTAHFTMMRYYLPVISITLPPASSPPSPPSVEGRR